MTSSFLHQRQLIPQAKMPNIVRITFLSGLCLATLVQSLPMHNQQQYNYHHQQAANLLPVMAQLHTYSSSSPRISSSSLWSDRQKRGLFSSLAALSDLASGASALSSSGGGAGSSLLANALSSGGGGGSKDPDDEGGLLSSSGSSSSSSSSSSVSKPIPYKFTSAEMTAIQAMVSLRDIISELLSKVGFNIPGIASFITRSEGGADKASSGLITSASENGLSSFSNTATKSTNVGVQMLRGLALLSPLIIPMATQIRRMSPDYSSSSFGSSGVSLPSLPSMSAPGPMLMPPMISFPDIYYNQAMHRRRGKRSTGVLEGRHGSTSQHLHQFQQHPLLNSPSLLRYLARLQQQAQHKWK